MTDDNDIGLEQVVMGKHYLGGGHRSNMENKKMVRPSDCQHKEAAVLIGHLPIHPSLFLLQKKKQDALSLVDKSHPLLHPYRPLENPTTSIQVSSLCQP